ncbi:MAG TPA: hypothetical protein VJC15_01415 [Candidatus Paceibacterota bacterium]
MKSTLLKVERLYELFHDGRIPRLAEHEVHPNLEKGSRENYLYFTLPPTINFQRSSPAMWRAALATWEDPETNYVFFPEKVAEKKFEQVQKDLLRHKLALQQNKHPKIWTTISSAFHKLFGGDPRNLLEKGEYDAGRIISLIQIEHKEDFPYLRGPKMANYWIYILNQYTDARFKNLNAISIIPDTHVIQSSIKLGLVEEGAGPEAVSIVWKDLLHGSRISPIDMHPVLWNWSRNNFLPEV